MRKSLQPGIDGNRERRPWLAKQRARAAGPGSARGSADAEDAAPVRADKHGKRFVEPYPYTDTQRAAIIAALAGAELGDESAREIFVGAIAYDLAVLAQALQATAEATPEAAEPADAAAGGDTDADARAHDAEHTPGPPDTSPAPPSDTATGAGELALAAARLADLLDALGTDGRERLVRALDASDPFGRSHGEGYLAALTREVRQVADTAASVPESRRARPARRQTAPSADQREPTRAGAGAASKRKARPKSETAAPPEHPEVPEAVLAFIRHAASVYEQCFDTRPTSKVSDPFARALAAVAQCTEIALPIRARVLKAALDSAG